MREFAAERFSEATPRLFIVYSRRFCAAPSVARIDETSLIAASMFCSAFTAFAELSSAAPERNTVLPPIEALPIAEVVSDARPEFALYAGVMPALENLPALSATLERFGLEVS